MKLIVYGSSDDLVEVEGDITAEFNGDEGVLSLSDGTRFNVEYAPDGIWKFTQTKMGQLNATIHPAVPEDSAHRPDGEFKGMSTYSEILVLEGDVEITSIGFGDEVVIAAKRPPREPSTKERRMRDEITEAIEASGDYKVSVIEGSADDVGTLRITVVKA